MRDRQKMTHCVWGRDEVLLLDESTQRAEVLIDAAVGVANYKEADIDLVHLSLLNQMTQVAEHVLVLHSCENIR